jgi:hypothetical protein
MNIAQAKSISMVTIVGAITTLIFATCKHYGLAMDGDTQNAVTTLVMAAGTWLAHRETSNA